MGTSMQQLGMGGWYASNGAGDNKNGSSWSTRALALRKACRCPLVVGVFMDQPLEEGVAKVKEVDVDVVQLHGAEDAQFLRDLQQSLPEEWGIPVTWRFELFRTMAVCSCSHCRCWSWVATTQHETCRDWAVLQVGRPAWLQVIVAGGLTDANVADAWVAEPLSWS
eukprot:Skav227578  [mRNA]  locus=scaffold517:130117:135917:- [translate_table: standard]